MYGVYFPYREDVPERLVNKESSEKYFTNLGYSVFYSDSQPGLPFNRGEARNRCVELALSHGLHAIAVCDVDCLPEPEPLAAAFFAAEERGGLHYPFTRVRRNYADGSWDMTESQDGGCMVVRPSEWRGVLGCPEFYSWGWEDKILLSRYRCWLGNETRYDGTLNHLYHPVKATLQLELYNHMRISQLYEGAQFMPWDLEELECNDALWDDAHEKDGSRRSRPHWS